MKQFFKFMLASAAGFFIAGFILIIVMFAMISASIGGLQDDKKVSIDDNTILEIKLDGPIKERNDNNPLDNFSLTGISMNKGMGLDEILRSLHEAKTDSKIKGILLNLSSLQTGLATLQEIRNALVDFKKSGKFIYAYSESYSQGGYYLATTADKIFLYPEGDIDLRGFRAEMMFYKGTLDKLEVSPEIIRHGKFKSAVEPFMLEKMSPENREQVTVFMTSMWDTYKQEISDSRKLSAEQIQSAADNLEGRNSRAAKQAGLVDQVSYFDEVLEEMKKKTGTEEKEKVKFVELRKYTKTYPAIRDVSAKKIAVIYANGEIVSGKGSDDQAGSDKVAEAIQKARQDSGISAIVLRVNSPGGSALASDVIWRETILAKKVKPFVVSMGDVAASGGYYIACAADKIIAQPTTITGSIGVFGLLFNAQKLYNNKLGITFDSVRTGRFANIGSTSYPLGTDERAIIQEAVESIYETFITHVSEGRKMSKEKVDSIGQGRVWSGLNALELGLVDDTGGINKAIEIAAGMAKLDKYRIIGLPEKKDFLQQLMSMSEETKVNALREELGEAYNHYSDLRSLLGTQGVIARMPYTIDIR